MLGRCQRTVFDLSKTTGSSKNRHLLTGAADPWRHSRMLRTNLNLNEGRARSYQAAFQKLASRAEATLAKLGFQAPFDDGEWTVERAVERLNRRALSPRVGAFLNAFNKVRASFLSAFSVRENVVESLHAVLTIVPDLSELMTDYSSARVSETSAEKLWADWNGDATIHCEERDERVYTALRRCLAATAETGEAYGELLALLYEERPPAVDALYGPKGGGPMVEFPMRAADENLEMSEAATWRGDFKRLPHLTGPARTERLKSDRAKAAARARSDAARARAAIAASAAGRPS